MKSFDYGCQQRKSWLRVAMANTPAHNTSKHSVNVNDTDGSLWTYIVEHSMRPQKELEELQKA